MSSLFLIILPGFPQKCVFTPVTNLEILDVLVPQNSQNWEAEDSIFWLDSRDKPSMAKKAKQSVNLICSRDL